MPEQIHADIKLEPIEFHYEFTPEDVETYYADYTEGAQTAPPRGSDQWYYILFYAALLSVPVTCFVYLLQWQNDGTLAFFGLIIAAVLWTPLLTRLWKGYALRKLKKYPDFVGKHRMRIDAEGVSGRTNAMAWTMFWSQMINIKLAKHHVLLYFRGQEQPLCMPLPRRVFDNDDEKIHEFIKRVYAFRESATSSQPPPS